EGMVRNSAWKFENASASWLDTYKGDIFSRDVIRRHYFQRECALMSLGFERGQSISSSFCLGTGFTDLPETTSDEVGNAAHRSTDPSTTLKYQSRPPPFALSLGLLPRSDFALKVLYN
ncbi:MAG: hypothetical protein WBO10_00635, partial [Pyrinomonadaceae bacterium]